MSERIPEVVCERININESEVLVFSVKNGLSKIGICRINSEYDKYCLYSHDEPVIAISGGMNDDDADKVISEYGSASGGSIIADSIDRAYEKLAAGGSPEYALEPLMRLLSDGLYAVSYVETYPTAGENMFFWSGYGVSKQLRNSSRNIRLIGDKAYSAPFLIPTEKPSSYDPSLIKKGKRERNEKRRYVRNIPSFFGPLLITAEGTLCGLCGGYRKPTFLYGTDTAA